MNQVQALEGDDGKRLDVIVRRFFFGLSLGQVFKAIRTGKIRLNFRRVCPQNRVYSGDWIQYYGQYLECNKLSQSLILPSCNQSLEASNVRILWENEDFLILNKSCGTVVHGERGSLEDLVLQRYVQNRSLSFKPGPCHRLDRQTTGVIVFSKTIKGARAFAEKQRENAFVKLYLGVVKGIVRSSLYWSHHLKYQDRKAFVSHGGKIAKTQITPIFYKDSHSLVIFRLHETGRTHQIRIQTSEEGHPLLGDFKYGGGGGGDQYSLHALSLIDRSSLPLFPPIWALPVPHQNFIDPSVVQKAIEIYRSKSF